MLPLIGITPYAALQVQDFHTPGYSETDLTGGGFAQSYNSMSATDTRSELGARFDDMTMCQCDGSQFDIATGAPAPGDFRITYILGTDQLGSPRPAAKAFDASHAS